MGGVFELGLDGDMTGCTISATNMANDHWISRFFRSDCGMLEMEMDHQKFRVDQQMTG